MFAVLEIIVIIVLDTFQGISIVTDTVLRKSALFLRIVHIVVAIRKEHLGSFSR